VATRISGIGSMLSSLPGSRVAYRTIRHVEHPNAAGN
jgi:hypothetical protein